MVTDLSEYGATQDVQRKHMPRWTGRGAGVLPATKVCRLCGKVLPLDKFYVRREAADGRKIVCKACENWRTVENRRRRVKGLPLLPRLPRPPAPPRPARAPHGQDQAVAAASEREAYIEAARSFLDAHKLEFLRILDVLRRDNRCEGDNAAKAEALRLLKSDYRYEWQRYLVAARERRHLPPRWRSITG